MTDDTDLIRYSWKVTVTTPSGRRRTHVMRSKMTKAEAAAWSAGNLGKMLELVPGSGETPGRPFDSPSSDSDVHAQFHGRPRP